MTERRANPSMRSRPARRPWFAAMPAVALLVGCTSTPAATPGADGSGAPPSATPSSGMADPSVSTATSASPAPTPEPLAWHPLDAPGPQAREDHTWTVDPTGSVAYLFGGRDGTTVFDDLWAFDLDDDAWTQVAADGGPAARFGHEAVWVDGIGLVFFAGQAGPVFFNDLWAFDPASASWRQLPAAGDVPVARYGSCAALGPDGRLWISHGFTSDGTRFADTRAYDFESAAWTDETPEGNLPVSRCLHGCWFTADGELALFGGQTTGVTALDDRWLLGADGWVRVDGAVPAARNLYARARVGTATLVVGGQALAGDRLADTWLLLDGEADAVPVEIEGDEPPGRSGAELVVDSDRGRVLLFGGLGEAGALADTWELHAESLIGR